MIRGALDWIRAAKKDRMSAKGFVAQVTGQAAGAGAAHRSGNDGSSIQRTSARSADAAGRPRRADLGGCQSRAAAARRSSSSAPSAARRRIWFVRRFTGRSSRCSPASATITPGCSMRQYRFKLELAVATASRAWRSDRRAATKTMRSMRELTWSARISPAIVSAGVRIDYLA